MISDFREAILELQTRKIAWDVEKTTDNYTELLRAHGWVTQAFANLFLRLFLPLQALFAVISLISAILGIWQFFQ